MFGEITSDLKVQLYFYSALSESPARSYEVKSLKSRFMWEDTSVAIQIIPQLLLEEF